MVSIGVGLRGSLRDRMGGSIESWLRGSHRCSLEVSLWASIGSRLRGSLRSSLLDLFNDQELFGLLAQS